MTQIAFIGLGNMGGPMAANLVKAGFAIRGFDLAESSKKAAAAAGIAVAASINDAVQEAETVITMLPAGQHVLDVWNEIVPLLEKAFGTWQAPTAPRPVKDLAAAIPALNPRVILIDRPNSPQSVITAGRVLPLTGRPVCTKFVASACSIPSL